MCVCVCVCVIFLRSPYPRALLNVSILNLYFKIIPTNCYIMLSHKILNNTFPNVNTLYFTTKLLFLAIISQAIVLNVENMLWL